MMNISLLVIGSSLVLQSMTALIAVRLIRQREKRIAGVFMLSAMLLMSLRPGISLYRLAEGERGIDLAAEITGCVISFMLLVGFLYLSRLIMSFQQKIEEHTRAEKTLRETYAWLESLIHAIPDMVMFKDVEGRHLLVNKAVEEVMGRKKEEFLGKTVEDLAPPELAKICKKSDEAGLRSRANAHFEEHGIDKKGKRIILDTIKGPIYDSCGNVAGLVAVSRNITERKNAEELIERLHHQNELILNAAGEGVYGVDLNGNTTFVNPAAAKMVGWEPEELVGKQQHDILHHSKPDGTPHPKADCRIYAAFKDGKVHQVNDEVFWRKDGTSFPVEYTSTPIWEDGMLVGAVVVFKNITERKRMEEALRESEQALKRSQATAHVGHWTWNIRTNKVAWSEEMHRLFGIGKDNFTGDLDAIIAGTIHPEDKERVMRSYKGVLSGKEPVTMEYRVLRPDGSIGHIWTQLDERIVDNNGRLVRLSGIAQDITERKRAEENLRLFLQAIEEAMDGIQIVDLEGRIIYSNTAVKEIYGYSSDEIIGKQVGELNVDTELARKVIIPSIQETDRWSGELMVCHKDGHEFPIWLSASMVKNEEGGPIAMLGIIRDVTQRKRAEEVLRRSHDDLEILVAERTAELTMVNEQLRNLSTHLQNARENERTAIAREIHDELGQSLTAIKMDLSLLRKRLPKGDKAVSEIAESMARLIKTTIRSVKRISTDLRPGILDHLGLTAAIEWQAEEFEKRTGIHCAVSFEPEEVVLDKDRTTTVFRIFQEALTNVARHAKATEVSVLLKVRDDGLMFQIRDNGKGITEKQVSAPKSLGLIGVRERVYYWGGSLTIDGSRNKGTTLTVQLPLDGRRGAH